MGGMKGGLGKPAAAAPAAEATPAEAPAAEAPRLRHRPILPVKGSR